MGANQLNPGKVFLRQLSTIIPIAVACSVMHTAHAQGQPPNDEAITKRMHSLVQTNQPGCGIVLGLIDDKGPRLLANGKTSQNSATPVDGDTIFEIGSVTKVFTGILLQDMVDKGEVKLDDPINKFLPSSVKCPSRNGKQITLLDLTTHSSGLPRLPDNMSMWHLIAHADNPYADYGDKDLYEFLSSYKLTRDIGVQYEYSNLGAGLLGQLLGLKAGTNYEGLLLTRICGPLQMTNTVITFRPNMKSRIAQGYTATGKRSPNWDFQALAGCGAIRSTGNDMLKFLAANMGRNHSDLTETLLRSQTPRRDAGAGQKIGLGWHISTDGVTWHNGQTGGYHSYLGFNKARNRGVVILYNSGQSIDPLGLFVLGPAREHTIAKVPAGTFERYVGKYELAPRVTITITTQNDKFFAQLTGQGKIEFFPESETEFFCKVVDAQLIFGKDSAGAVSHLVLHQNGLDQKAKKVE